MVCSLNSEASVVLDACVLAPMPLCDTLLRCAEEYALFRPLWSAETLVEVRRDLKKFGRSASQIERRMEFMQNAFPEACIHLSAILLEAVPEIPDSGDRHVVAVAIQAKAQAIVTFNLRHFPRVALEPFGITVYSPDKFLMGLFGRNPDEIVNVLDQQAKAIGQSRESVLERLKAGLPEFVVLASERQG
jgi:predicted nucleic acid-binding protein